MMHQAFNKKFTGQIILQRTNLGKLQQQICAIPTFAGWLYQYGEAIMFICAKREFHEGGFNFEVQLL